MKEEIKKAVENYQCPGCVWGSDISCYEYCSEKGVECQKHAAGTTISPIGRVFLGMPKGFNRLGVCDETEISIFEKFEDSWGYDKFNVPVWKYLDDNGNTLVRGLCPRVNYPFIHIFIGNVLSKIDCMEITRQDIDKMD